MLVRRYAGLYASFTLAVCSVVFAARGSISWVWCIVGFGLLLVGLRDMMQTRHSILRNYPIAGHLRFLLEFIRPEIRQYFIESDKEETPFSRASRSVVYQRAKNELDSKAFGTDLQVQDIGHEWINHSMSPTTLQGHDFRITVGEERSRPYSLSVLNISAMSFGALSANAIRALNKGAKMGNFAHDTGEGSISPYHREHGGDLIWEIASGYFGCRTGDGRFDPDAFAAQATQPQVKMIEIKLSQGAKPGHGGVLPAAKVTAEIAATRGIAIGKDCISPAAHSEFSTPTELLQFVERLRRLSGDKPTGFKLCIGQPWEFFGIVKAIRETGIVPDFIVVDGAEGGTGAAPLELVDHVGMPLQDGLRLVHNTLKGAGLRNRVKLGASGKLVTAFDIARILAIGADYVNMARPFMMSLGCIQAGKCNTSRCPTGVATQDARRQRALVVPDKAERVLHFHHNTLHALKELVQAAGLDHPGDLRPHHVMRRVSAFEVRSLADILEKLEPGDLLRGRLPHPVFERWWPVARSDAFAVMRPRLPEKEGQAAAPLPVN